MLVTLPFTTAATWANVDLDKAAAAPILSAIRNDTPWPPPVTVDADGKKLDRAPADISVRAVDSRAGGQHHQGRTRPDSRVQTAGTGRRGR